jgi:hypothetical protein
MGNNYAWILGLAVYAIVATSFLVIAALALRNFLAVSPAALRREFEQLKEELSSAHNSLRLEWSQTQEQLIEETERQAKERHKAQMERGRIEKAAQQIEVPLGVDGAEPASDINAARRMARAQGYKLI